VCNPCSFEKKTVAFSAKKGTPEDDPVSPRWKLSKPLQSRTKTPQAKVNVQRYTMDIDINIKKIILHSFKEEEK